MRKDTRFDQNRYRPAALITAAAAGLVAFSFACLLLKPTSPEQSQLVAVIRERGLPDDASIAQRDQAVAAWLSPENLASAIHDAHFAAGDGLVATSTVELAEKIRDQLRVDLGPPDEAGVQTISLRWTGETSSPAAARLLNHLARRFVSQLSTRDVRPYETAYDSAQKAVTNASREVAEARQRLESAVAVASASRQGEETPTPAPTEPIAAPRLAPRLAPDPEGWLLLQQQLADLEGRRLTLAERLMPEHPEMKALDEKIATIRARLADRVAPRPDFSLETEGSSPSPVPKASSPHADPTVTTRIALLGEELLAAQARLASAAQQERACWHALCSVRNRGTAEIEPATAPTHAGAGGWPRWIVASLCGLLCGGLILAIWPVRRLTFGTVDEVRAVTRLPVVVVPRGSLN